MRKKRLLWRLLPPLLLVALAAIGLSQWAAYRALHAFYLEQTASALEASAQLAAAEIAGAPEKGIDSLMKVAGRRSGLRLTLILPGGRVAADSHEDPARMENHGDRPEVADALQGKLGQAVRFSHTLRMDMMYVAVPLKSESELPSAVRAALPLTSVNAPLKKMAARFLSIGSLTVFLLALTTLLISRRLTRPLEQMGVVAQQYASGHLSERMADSDSMEISALAQSFNSMARELEARIKTVERQREELSAMLASMAEGVIALGADERILSFNRAAAHLFSLSEADSQGKKIYEAVRVPAMQEVSAEVLETRSFVEREVTLLGSPQRELWVRGTPLQGEGALLVVTDRTRLKKLENLRREFAANVSHELKTPLTAIKGFLETLLDGAVDDPKEARRFLQIAAQETNRLNQLIDDLLELAHLEQASGGEGLPRENRTLLPILKSIADRCGKEASERGIFLEVACDAALSANIHPDLLERAVINLVDNAVKYCGVQKPVTLSAEKTGDGVVIRVRDRGAGIAAEHLPRIFERFYRVDKSRSKKLGGTGLGLSIVKHIALAHGGRVEVESVAGEGSLFSIFLPG